MASAAIGASDQRERSMPLAATHPLTTISAAAIRSVQIQSSSICAMLFGTTCPVSFFEKKPLIPRNDDMVAKSRDLLQRLRRRWMVEYDDGGQIGRRYRRQDEIGTPWAFTIDDQTLEDDTVTVRDRDSLAQERLSLADVPDWLDEALQRPWHSPKP